MGRKSKFQNVHSKYTLYIIATKPFDTNKEGERGGSVNPPLYILKKI